MISILVHLTTEVLLFYQLRLDNLLNEKENVEREFNTFQREVKHSSLADTAKEIRVLKKVIKNLEVNSLI